MDLHPLVTRFVDPKLALHSFEDMALVVAGLEPGLRLGIHDPTLMSIDLRFACDLKFKRVHHFLQHSMIAILLFIVFGDAPFTLPFRFLLTTIYLLTELPFFSGLVIGRKGLAVYGRNNVIRRALDHHYAVRLRHRRIVALVLDVSFHIGIFRSLRPVRFGSCDGSANNLVRIGSGGVTKHSRRGGCGD